LCAACDKGYYLFSGKCTVCSENVRSTVFAVAIVLVLIGFLAWQWRRLIRSDKAAAKRMSRQFNSISIFLTFMQTVVISLHFDMDWPESVQKFASAVNAFFMFDLFTFVSPECTVKLAYTVRWFAQLVSPLTLLLIGMGLTAHVRRMEGQGTAGYNKHEWEKVRAKKEAIEQLNTGFLLAWYLTMVNKSLQPFACSSGGEGRGSVLDADPNIMCWESGEHTMLAVLGGLAFVAFGLLLPYAMYAAIKRTASVKCEVCCRLGALRVSATFAEAGNCGQHVTPKEGMGDAVGNVFRR
jgi:hypothetical protein